MATNGMRPVHPGEVLREEFLTPLNVSVDALAVALRLPYSTLDDIIKERERMRADTALRLSRYFGTTPEFWLNLQMAFDLRTAIVTEWERIAREVEPFASG